MVAAVDSSIYAVLGLLLGMSMVLFRNPIAVVVEQAVRAVLGPQAQHDFVPQCAAVSPDR